MRQTCLAKISESSNNFPLIKFVPEGYTSLEIANAPSILGSRNRGVVVSFSPPLAARKLKRRYGRGYVGICRMDWGRQARGLGPNQDEFLGPLFLAKLQGKNLWWKNRFYRLLKIHQNALIFFHPSDGCPKLPLPEATTSRSLNRRCNPNFPRAIWTFWHFQGSLSHPSLFFFPENASSN